MYIPEFRVTKSGVPVLRQEEIDGIAEKFIKDFQPNALVDPQPLELEDFVESYLGNIQDYQYLSNNGVYLGMTIFEDTNFVTIYRPETNDIGYISARARTIIIDRNLIDDPLQEHRYRFTLAHEGGHTIFHNAYFSSNPSQQALIRSLMPPAILCRKENVCNGRTATKGWGDLEWMEWQANTFSSALLMPKPAVKRILSNTENTENAIKEMMSYFNVSRQAATYRLNELK